MSQQLRVSGVVARPTFQFGLFTVCYTKFSLKEIIIHNFTTTTVYKNVWIAKNITKTWPIPYFLPSLYSIIHIFLITNHQTLFSLCIVSVLESASSFVMSTSCCLLSSWFTSSSKHNLVSLSVFTIIVFCSTPPRAPFDHIWAMVWSGVRGNITITAL